MADRYAYIPLIGIFVMVAFGAADLVARKEIGVGWWAIPAAAALIFLAVITHRQIGYWQSSQFLWAHTLEVTQNNFVAEDNLGGALLLEGKPEEAFPHFEAAARINPHDPMSRGNLGAYFQSHGRISEAITQYEEVIALTGDPGLLAQTYANLVAAQRVMGEDEPAHGSFDEALRLNPNQFNAWLGMGLLAQKQGNLNDAIVYLSRSVELRPTGAGYFNLGRSLQQAGRGPEALVAYRQALKFSPELTEAQQAADALSGHQP